MPATAAQVQSVVEAANFKVVNMLTSPMSSATQIQLEVRVAEVNRNKLRDYSTSFLLDTGRTGGYANSGGGPSTDRRLQPSALPLRCSSNRRSTSCFSISHINTAAHAQDSCARKALSASWPSQT